MEEIRLNVNNIEICLCDKFLIYTDYGDEESNDQNYHDIKKLFDLIDYKYYDLIEDINLKNIYISGNLWKELYRFKNLKSVKYGDHDDSSDDSFKMNKLEFKYNNNIEIYDQSFELSFELIFEFYKHDLFKAGLNEVNLYKNNKQISEMIKILSDDLHKNSNGFYIFKDKFGNYSRF